VRRNAGGGLAPRPRMGTVQARDRAEKRATTRLRWKSSLEGSPGMVNDCLWLLSCSKMSGGALGRKL
jgi:hypothetical protein